MRITGSAPTNVTTRKDSHVFISTNAKEKAFYCLNLKKQIQTGEGRLGHVTRCKEICLSSVGGARSRRGLKPAAGTDGGTESPSVIDSGVRSNFSMGGIQNFFLRAF